MVKINHQDNRISTAVILAAGVGSRFKSYTKTMPKGFIPVLGKPMITRTLDILVNFGIKRIIIGTGYKKEFYEALKNDYPQIECCYNPFYVETNSMYTLYNCKSIIGGDDFFLLESDLIFEKKAISALLDSEYASAMLITPVTKIQDQYYVEMNKNNELINCNIDKTKLIPNGELVGIHKVSNFFFQQMCVEYDKIITEQPKLGYEFHILYISNNILPMNVIKIDKLKWYEIDDEVDLKYVESKYAKFV